MSQHSERPGQPDGQTGISNRESAAEEARERAEHPPLDTGPSPADAAEGLGDGLPEDLEGDQTSRKSGLHSTAQKQERARDPERPTPPARPVSGAFGKEPE